MGCVEDKKEKEKKERVSIRNENIFFENVWY
jgi:hypothetical protein